MQKIFFTSDTHFGHENAIRFDNRPFANAAEMDAELTRRWNAKVGTGDLVYVLGDMIWKSLNNDAEPLIKSLNGQIILIKGNHDRFINNAKAKKALAGIKDYDDIVFKKEKLTIKEAIKNGFLPSFDGEPTEEEYELAESRREFIEESQVKMIVNIYKLKHNKEYSDLGDYYLALRRKFGLVTSSLSFEMNSAIGDEMLFDFSLMGNKYAKKFLGESEE